VRTNVPWASASNKKLSRNYLNQKTLSAILLASNCSSNKNKKIKTSPTMMQSSVQCSMPEALKPGSVPLMLTIKAKLPVLLMPIGIIVVVYFVDSAIFWVTSSATGKTPTAEETDGSGYSVLEALALVACIIVPLAYFNLTDNNKNSRPKVPTASDASARLRAQTRKPPQEQDATVAPKLKSLSEQFRDSDKATSEAQAPQSHVQSKAAGSLARWNQAINNAAKAGQTDKAVQLLSEISAAGLEPDAISYNSVIHAFAKKGEIRQAEKWLVTMEENAVEANTISYNILMDACVKSDNADGAEMWLQRMQNAGIEPNEVSYATVIHARAKRGDSVVAEQWLRKMIASGVEPNVVSYNSLIYACGKKGQCAQAETWIEEMEARGIEARVTTYTAVIDACAKSGDVERAEKWMEKMIEKEIEPNVVSYSAMIDACAKGADPERAELWHTRMLLRGVQPNAHSFSAVINACAKAGDVTSAVHWLEQMENSGVPVDVVVFSGVLDACAKAGDCEKAKMVFHQMRMQGVVPNVISYAALARPFAHNGDWQEVENIAEQMKNQGLMKNDYFLYAELLAYASAKPREAERAEQCFRDARSLRIQVNKHVLTVLARAVGRVKANQLVEDLKINIKPDSKR